MSESTLTSEQSRQLNEALFDQLAKPAENREAIAAINKFVARYVPIKRLEILVWDNKHRVQWDDDPTKQSHATIGFSFVVRLIDMPLTVNPKNGMQEFMTSCTVGTVDSHAGKHRAIVDVQPLSTAYPFSEDELAQFDALLRRIDAYKPIY